MHSRLTRGVRPHLEGKQRTPLSSRVATDISWSPLSGLQGAKLPVDFGDRTRYCSPGHAEKEGPLLAMTGAFVGFLELRHKCGVSHVVRLGAQEPLVWRQGSQVSMRVARGSASLLSCHDTGIGPQDAFKKDSRGLSHVAAGKPGFPRLGPVNSGSFSGCL